MERSIPYPPINLFYCYADEDEALCRQLEKHLSVLINQGYIKGWHHRKISGGAERDKEITTNLNKADIILLLMSTDFMNSKYYDSDEMKIVWRRHKSGEARVVPIILSNIPILKEVLHGLQPLPLGGKAIKNWSNREDAFANVAEGIRRVVDELNTNKNVNSGDSRGIISNPALPHLLSPDSIFLFNQALLEPGEFYGRSSEQRTLINRVRRRAAISIVGSRRIGKTWLVKYLKFMVQRELGTQFVFGYVDAKLPKCTTITGFTMSVMQSLGMQKPLFNNEEYPLIFLQQALQVFKSEKKIPVVCIDEFEGLDNRHNFDLDFFSALRAIAHDEDGGLCLITISQKPLIQLVSNEIQTSPFFNIFEQFRLGPFTTKEAEQFVQSKGNQAGLTEQERRYLLFYGQVNGTYWPIRLQLVGYLFLQDKMLAVEEQDQERYRPEDPHYWQDFKTRLEEKWGAVFL